MKKNKRGQKSLLSPYFSIFFTSKFFQNPKTFLLNSKNTLVQGKLNKVESYELKLCKILGNVLSFLNSKSGVPGGGAGGNYHICRYGMCHFLGCLFSSRK